MPKRVLDVGQCQPDHGAIRRLICGSFDAEIEQALGTDDALSLLRGGRFDLVLVNRKLDADYSDGMEVLRRIKNDPELSAIPVMLVSNYADAQQAAIAAGAEPGFGKNELGKPQTRERLAKFLSDETVPRRAD